jgi:hypothetical protein
MTASDNLEADLDSKRRSSHSEQIQELSLEEAEAEKR